MTREIKKVAICGAGAMGLGIAQVAAQAGMLVVVYDVSSVALSSGRARIEAELATLISKSKIEQAHAEKLTTAISWSSEIYEIADTDLVIEAVVEDLAVKKSLFKTIEEAVSVTTIIATNTSSLPIARLARDLKNPGRFIGMHFFNPPTAMRLIEVVPGPATETSVTADIEYLSASWGKSPVRVADVPGFIVNRVARPFYAEAFRAIQEVAASPQLIDALFRMSAGFRMGPLELTDLIGQDINFAVARSVYDSYFGVTRFTPQLGQAALVDAGWLGRKSSRGVYDYRDGNSMPDVKTSHSSQKLSDPVGRPEKVGPSCDAIEIGGVVVRFARGRTARSESTSANCPVALLDWFDVERGSAVGFCASDENVADIAASLITSWGMSAYRFSDRPGGIVLRTLAQIANAAADAVFEQVSSEVGIDLALKYGANYPFGPFAWADGIGRLALVQVLVAMAQETGQDMYRPSQYLMREATE